jgi:hypothetical protein
MIHLTKLITWFVICLLLTSKIVAQNSPCGTRSLNLKDSAIAAKHLSKVGVFTAPYSIGEDTSRGQLKAQPNKFSWAYLLLNKVFEITLY